MKRHEKLIPLSKFHRSVLFLALIAKKNAPDVKGYPKELKGKVDYAISFYRDQLLPHFELEERELFSKLPDKKDDFNELITVFLKERDEIKSAFQILEGSDNPETDLHNLGVTLEKHIRKEERVIFQKIQELLSEEDWAQINIQMNNSSCTN